MSSSVAVWIFKVLAERCRQKANFVCLQHENDQQHGISGEPFNVGKRFISLNACAGRANCRVV